MGGFLFCYQFSRDGGEGFMDEFAGVLFGGAHGTSDWGVRLVLFVEEVNGLEWLAGFVGGRVGEGLGKAGGDQRVWRFRGTWLPLVLLRER